MLVRIRERFPIRAIEWFSSILMILLGFYFLLWPGTFYRSGLIGFTDLAPAAFWIMACVVIGALRIGALILNGHKPEISAPIRLFGSAMGVGLYLSFAAAFALTSDEHGPALETVVFLAITLADLYSAARAGTDSANALAGDKKWIGSRR